MVLTVTEDTPADMLAGSMELLVQLPREHHLHTQRVTVQRSTPMMDLLVQIATAHKLAASSYTLQAIGERGTVLPHQPNTPIGALDALQVKLLPKQGTFVPRKTKQANQPFETTFRLQVHLPRNQLYVSRVSPKMNLGDILEEVCREKNLDKNKYELRHPANLEEVLDLSLSLQDYHLQEVTLYAKQGRSLGSALSSQDIMALQRQEERRRQQAKQGVFGFMFKKSKEGSLSTDSLGGRSASPARSDETGRSASPLQPPARPQRKRRPAPKPPTQLPVTQESTGDTKDKVVISHSRNSSDSSGYHEASVLSDNPDSAGRLPETLPRRSRAPGPMESPRKLAHTSQSSKSLGNLATVSGSLSHATSSTSLSSTGLRKKRAAPPPPVTRPLSSAISTQALERIVDSEESLTSDMDPSKPPSDIGAPSKANSDIDDRPKASSDIGVTTVKASQMEFKASLQSDNDLDPKKLDFESRHRSRSMNVGKSQLESTAPVDVVPSALVEPARVTTKRETDILLQKVSDTLSNSLPSKKEASPSPPPEPKIHRSDEKPEIAPLKQTEPKSPADRIEPTRVPDGLDIPDGTILNTSTPNMTLGSQQDTSDYVSAVGDDLSITDWEYQLPAPPSAFRDTNSPVFDGYDTITLRSVDAFKEPEDLAGTEAKEAVKSSQVQEQTEKSHPVKESRGSESIAKEDKVEEKPKQRKEDKRESSTNRKANSDLELKKEMINELENKIGTLPQTMNKEHESRRMEDASTPKIAPVDNTLSNFKIMTYTKQKSLNIFEEGQQETKGEDDRFIKSFATLSRNRNNNESVKEFLSMGSLQSKTSTAKGDLVSLNDVDASKSEPKMQEALHRWQPINSGNNEKTSVQRSKSYVSGYENSKRRGEVQENEQDQAEEGMRKATNTMSFNVGVKNNEKFSQWRENILKRQEEPTKEKQLQSLQVLKSILPQLKNAQQAEESVPKEYNSAVLIERARPETASDEHSVESNVVPTRSSQKIESEGRKSEENSSKRYTYSGPPAISLGSWSERPSVNVQIKMDTDYKLGGPNKAFGKTVVSINGTKEEKPINHIERTMSNPKQEAKTESKQFEEPSKKVIPAALTFKKPTLNKVNVTDPTKNPDKPVVTGVELKKSFIEKNETTNNNENVIDTTPVNFKELTKAFGAEVCLRPKPKRLNVNRRSEGFEAQTGQRITESSKTNGFPERLSVQEPVNGHSIQNGTQSNGKPKRFTSVVGINPQNQMSNGNFQFRSNVNVVKGNGPMPVVKGFKLQSSQLMKNETVRTETNGSTENCRNVSQPPKPPTMPVITGVTLKSASARSKSMPVQVDPRNVLLESIRNFGGRENLKSAAKRC